MLDIAILGAGPAGLSAAASAAKHGLSHVLIEKGEIGNTVFCYQLRKHVMAEPSKLPLRSLVPFDAGSRENVLDFWAKASAEHNVNCINGEVMAIEPVSGGFLVKTNSESFEAKRVVLAIGLQGSPRKLGVPGERPERVSYTLRDPDEFNGKRIFIVGAGDAAIENALALAANNTVFILNRGADFPLAKDANIAAILKAIDNGKVQCYYNSSVASVGDESITLNTSEGEETVVADHIIARIGAIMPRRFMEGCGINFPNADPTSVPVVSSSYESNVPGLYILGALIGYPLIKQCLNQGFEVIEHILGNHVEPADQVLIDEKLDFLEGSVPENFAKIRESLPLFTNLSESHFRELIIDSNVRVLKAGDTVFKLNDHTDTVFSVISGTAAIELPHGRSIAIEKGAYFGEMSLLSGRKRSATVVMAQDGWLLETPRKQMLKLISAVESVREDINKKFLRNALETSIFPDVDVSFINKLTQRAVYKSFKKGEVLFNEGEQGDFLYVIRKGSVKVSRRNSDGLEIAQAYLPAGHYVGEMALLSDLPRTATVSAAVACETVAISKEDFLDVIQNNPRAEERISKLAQERRIENLTTEWDASSGELLDFFLKQGISDAENVLLIDSDLCVGCDNCETACAATHDGYSRLDRKGGKSFASIQVPISCRHCENPLCMLDCPPDAIHRQPNGEVVIQESCIGCGNCVRNCPYGVIQMIYPGAPQPFSLLGMLGFSTKPKEKGAAKAGKCDMCSSLPGGPACVRSCPTGAAFRVNPKELIKIISEKQK